MTLLQQPPQTPSPSNLSPAPAGGGGSGGGGRARVAQPVTNRIRRDGKFFRLGPDKFYVKGVTYGPLPPGDEGLPFASRDQTKRDFQQMRELGANCLRIYHIPPPWFLDLAHEMGLKVFVDVAWPKNLTFTIDEHLKQQAHAAVREAAERCGNHPATFAISVVNEIPADIVRYVGRSEIEDFVDALVATVKSVAPECLATFANFPTTEYLLPRDIDFVCFNVYLHDDKTFRNYLARLQSIAGEKPLMLGEYGIDTHREYSEEKQAQILGNHIKAVFDEGLVGTFIFAFSDDWFTHGFQIEDWKFGITRRDRSPKPAFDVVRDLFARAPQLTELALPRVSVVICSYNGASTVESCLRSMQTIRYHLPDGSPNFEVLFVDDGSKDHTQEILKSFATETRPGIGVQNDDPRIQAVRKATAERAEAAGPAIPHHTSDIRHPTYSGPSIINIVQKNMGLSYARNVGMNAATGEITVYTDSDCEADPDWLYYFALALVRGGEHMGGMGGPNLIPDEGSWVADCVGLSPGGPTHVMIDDRTAEHVPGCNMGFWTHVLKAVNGFDPQYRKAGDDVDAIWRVQALGYHIGFSPSAQVWHYRRNTVKAYLNQQRGYGEAEALLKYKHPEHFNALGASHWRGRIYGGDQIGVRFGGDVIYHGIFGTGLFQTLYRKPASMLAAMLMSIEWHLLWMFVFVLGLAFTPLLWFAGAMVITPVALAITAAVQSPRPRHSRWLTKPLIAYLHFRQPIARGYARYTVRLRAKDLRTEARGYARPNELPLDPLERRTLRYWHHQHDRITLLEAIRREVEQAKWRHRIDSGWGAFDLEIYGSRYVKVKILTATEHHHGAGMLTRVRVRIVMSNFSRVLFVAVGLLTLLVLIHLWPFSRPAVLMPLAGWAMYLYNKYRVSRPVLGLIDEAAEKVGFWPVPTKPPR
jgi:glycosyltransferase involved in cell wall biosynthesis